MKVTLEGITKVFPPHSKKESPVTAVSNFNLEIPDGKLVALLGPSGCGKSTLLNMICGLEAPTSGSVFFDENDVTKLPPEKRGVGMVFQNYALYPHMSARKNILFPLGNLKGKAKLTKEEKNKRMLDAARIVQIENLLERKPGNMSGGQQQRVAIARALVKYPGILLLDEPLSNLDARLRLETREEIRRIQKNTGITTVFVTHDQEEAMSISDIIVLMKKGVFQQSGKPQDVYDNPANLFVAKFLGTPAINVFKGRIEGGKVYIGDEAVSDVPGCGDRKVFVGIRPEGFIPDKNGPLTCDFRSIDVLGRDYMIVAAHGEAEAPVIRAIVDSENKIEENPEKVRFSFKKNKFFVFDAKTEERIYVG
ncbi:MAG: ABC transporter ATP-binding protein [Clostridia bacterium]|nr:ABC transporter ATP-binding protein [Clostridia bacterium]